MQLETTTSKPLSFFVGREHLAMHRNGQSPFLPHAMLKQREKAINDHIVSSIAEVYMLVNQNECI
uniref:hypothetical protein n=1 Tax=Bacillus cytotoxicus TaxID=580165 RepID=UPI0020402D22